MAVFGSRADDGDRRGVIESGGDAVQLVIDYLKQETIEPLQGLQRFLIYGVTGSLAISVGLSCCWSPSSVSCRPRPAPSTAISRGCPT